MSGKTTPTPAVMERGQYNAIVKKAKEAERLAIFEAYRDMPLEDFQVWLYQRCGFIG